MILTTIKFLKNNPYLFHSVMLQTSLQVSYIFNQLTTSSGLLDRKKKDVIYGARTVDALVCYIINLNVINID